MTAAVKLPDNAPFAADAVAALNRVIVTSTPTQRAWLAGFLAGVESILSELAAPTVAVPVAAASVVAAPVAAIPVFIAPVVTTAVAAPPAVRPALTILFATESGNSEALAAKAKKEAIKLGYAAKLLDAADATPTDLDGNLLVITSTWGEGEAPARAVPFLNALLAEDAPRLETVNFAVLALGDRAYAKFCETGHQIDARLEALGARRAVTLLECDLDYDEPAAVWLTNTLPTFKVAAEASVIHVDFGHPEVEEAAYDRRNPLQAEITDLVNLNGSRSAKETFHVELSLEGSGLTYQPGDAIGVVPENDPAVVEAVLTPVGLGGDTALHAVLAAAHDVTTLSAHFVQSYAALTGDSSITALAQDPARLAEYLPGRQPADLFEDYPHRLTAPQLTGLLRKLPPRLYSVASSMASVGAEAHLLIGAVRYEAHGKARAGVTSGFVADRRKAGDRLQVYVKPNTHFRLPADPAIPVIMIGPGTGVAPFRGFMQERDAAGISGKSWLFFGDRSYTQDFLYQLEWQDLLARGVLSRIDVAFSRDQDQKQYVQHRLWDQRRDLHAWLKDGAYLYVCGDQNNMARDVHGTLRDLIADQSSTTPEAAEAELASMKQQGRYLLDVY